ncbi:MAG: hypothetical protein L7S62_01350 [Flavobacteriales bacterium]|nr:hypothetical protein [Flavobacteriales bacterium]
MAVSLKRTAHEHLKALAFDEKKNRKWDVHIPKQVDVMRISNVVNDEFPRDELFRVAVVSVVVICVLMVRVIMPFVVRVVVVVIRIFGVSVLGIVAIRFMPVVLCPKP